MPRCSTSLFLGLLTLVACASVAFGKDPWTTDTLADVAKNVQEGNAVLVDVREESEWDKSHLEASLLLPLSTLKKGVTAKDLEDALPNDKVVYTFCVVGKRAVTAAKILGDFGYDVRPLKPGYEDLHRAGFKKSKS